MTLKFRPGTSQQDKVWLSIIFQCLYPILMLVRRMSVRHSISWVGDREMRIELHVKEFQMIQF